MITISDAFRRAEKDCIIIWHDFTKKINGLYCRKHNQGFIGLSNHIIHNEPLLRSTLYEELGHHWTSPKGNFIGPHFSYVNRGKLLTAEKAALRWAADNLIDDWEFREVGQLVWGANYSDEVGELARQLGVTRDIVDYKYFSMKDRGEI